MHHNEIIEHKKGYTHVKVGMHWATDLLRSLNYPEFIKASDLLVFIENCGLEDLRSKYENKSSRQSISSYPLAKVASREEEMEILGALKPLFEKTITQLGIGTK